MPNDLDAHLDTGRRLLRRMAASPCEFIEIAFEAEKLALETTGADRKDLRAAVQTLDAADGWSESQRASFVAYVSYLDERIDDR